MKMKRTTTNSFILTVILLVIVGLNLLFYIDPSADEETEQNGSRSTYSARPFGTRAFYLLLRERGHQVTQFEEQMDRLQTRADIKSLFIIGPPPSVPYSQKELKALEEWVLSGGTVAIVDRQVDWPLSEESIHIRTYSKYKQWRLPRITQPTPLTMGVTNVQLTEFAQGVMATNAPVTEHIGDQDGSVLIDFRLGQGRIILLGEPYVVANNGIGQSDNLTLALNIVRSLPEGVIAFDEYHHGYGTILPKQTGLIGVFLGLHTYFRRTPLIWILLQACLLAGTWLYSRGRRFARPLSLPIEKRQRAFEYVASLANLAHRQGLRSFVLENLHHSLKSQRSSLSALGPVAPSNSRGSAQASLSQSELNQLLQVSSSPNNNTMDDHELLNWAKRVRDLQTRLGRRK